MTNFNKNSINKIKKLELYKANLQNILNKNCNFSVQDFELYLKHEYDVKIFNSVKDLYKNIYNINITKSEKDIVDVLVHDIIKADYKIAYLTSAKNNLSNDMSTELYYSYKNNKIEKIFVMNGLFPISEFLEIFYENGEQEILKNIESNDKRLNETDIKEVLLALSPDNEKE